MKNKGYTLIEIMVAVGIFTVIIAAPTGFFVSALKAQQKALASQELFDNVSYGFEYMSRALRMAKKELSCDADEINCACLKNTGYGFNYEITRDGHGIRFNNYQTPSVCQEFFLDTTDNRIKESKNGGEAIPLTSDKVKVISFKIGPEASWDQSDNEQPRVSLFLEAKGARGELSELQPEMKIQTTVSQRNLDVIY